MFRLVELIMDRESLLKLGLTACALGVSLFIFWGPKLGTRRPRFGSSLLGLQNLGLTCFLNSLLQALASCPYFIDWLESHKGNGNVTDSLLSLLNLLCYEREAESGVVSPSHLISSLSSHGWAIAPQEQDAHELFLLLVTTLEEEEHKAAKVGLGMLSESLRDLTVIGDSYCKVDKSAGDSPVALTKMDITSPTRSLCDIKTMAPPFRGYLASQMQCLTCSFKSPMRYDKFDTLSLALPPLSLKQGVTLRQLLDCFVKTEVIDDFICEACNKDKPEGNPSKTSKATRTVRIGKLPKCLCLHISRTYITTEGIAYKRDNYVDFPEYLAMGPYTQNSYLKEAKMSLNRKKKLQELVSRLSVNIYGDCNVDTGKGEEAAAVGHMSSVASPVGVGSPEGVASPARAISPSRVSLTDSLDELASPDGRLSPVAQVTGSSGTSSWVTPTGSPGNERSTASLPPSAPSATPSHINYAAFINGIDPYCNKQLYRLKAVVEHRGTVDNGHFVTYRRGPLKSNVRHRCSESSEDDRWYFTSDADVRESSMCHAMMSCAYMIFYEKCSVFEER